MIFMHKNNNKGQMEMIGLVIIVILITLGMLFFTLLAVKESPEKKIFTRKGLAYSTMSAVMKTTIIPEENCVAGSAVSLELGKDILEDCALNAGSYRRDDPSNCGFGCQYHCRGLHSCAFFNQKIEELLQASLGRWNKRYSFTSQLLIPGSDRSLSLAEIKGRGGCSSSQDKDSSGLFPIQAGDAGLVENVLFLCD
ncbi:TPA: hypothetical protein HA234_03360 [Candidatus Woesearchaeota archaeon]|nr:hypothetical protein [Candidatus Woesearchaeota archaeon]